MSESLNHQASSADGGSSQDHMPATDVHKDDLRTELAGVPQELRELSQWVARRGKVPVDPRNGRNAKVSDPIDMAKARRTWGSLEQSLTQVEQHGFTGVGFVFSEDDPYCGVDLDNCRDSQSGEIEEWAMQIVDALNSYTEVSPSGTGLHVILKGTLRRSLKSGHIEMYDHGRFFTFTGEHLDGTPVELRSNQDYLEKLQRTHLSDQVSSPPADRSIPDSIRSLTDAQLIDLILQRYPRREAFSRLYFGNSIGTYSSQSEADLALCSMLAYWSGGDRERIDRMFRKSALMRSKWDENRGEKTYGQATIETALRGKDSSDFWTGPVISLQERESEIFTAAELEGMVFPDPRWAVKDLLAEGLGILGGRPKIGKSWLAIALGTAIATGGNALGNVPVEAGDVLYLALEDQKRRLQERMTRIMQGDPWPEKLHLSNSWPQTGSGGIEMLDEWCEEHTDARLIIVDTLARIRPTRSGKGDLYAEDYQVGAQLKALADRHNLAVLVVHHLRKMDSDDPLELLSGTLGLPGAADSVLVMKRERTKQDASLFVTGRDIEERELAVEWSEARWQWILQGSADEYRRSEARSEILALLEKEDEHLSPKEIAEALGKKDTAVRQLLRSMVSDGEVERHGTSSHTRYGMPRNRHEGQSLGQDTTHDNHDDHGATQGNEYEDDDVFSFEAVVASLGKDIRDID